MCCSSMMTFASFVVSRSSSTSGSTSAARAVGMRMSTSSNSRRYIP